MSTSKVRHRFKAWVSDGRGGRRELYYGHSESEAIKHGGTALRTIRLFGVEGQVYVTNCDKGDEVTWGARFDDNEVAR